MDKIWFFTSIVYLYLGSGALYPIFGKVIDILVSGAHIFVKVMDYDTICFVSHYNAFVIELQQACTKSTVLPCTSLSKIVL